ncbi:N-acetyltransferase [Bacilli bacterium]|nr:N-acetyltransferase [Bacilli bacterium]GHU46396.1 N-acetyltransferase [Bacilli bacterium]
MITYKTGNDLPIADVIDVYKATPFFVSRRPVDDMARMTEMFKNSNLVISAWSEDELVGIARALTDFSYTTYLSDLVVKTDFQRQGIGQKLIQEIQAAAPMAKIVLLAAPQAVDYYPHIGFEKHESAWVKQNKLD